MRVIRFPDNAHGRQLEPEGVRSDEPVAEAERPTPPEAMTIHFVGIPEGCKRRDLISGTPAGVRIVGLVYVPVVALR